MNKWKKTIVNTFRSQKDKLTRDFKITHTIPPSKHTSITTLVESPDSVYPNWHLIWLDSNIDQIKRDDCIDIFTPFQGIISTIETFTNVDECINRIIRIRSKKIIMIISEALKETALSVVHPFAQLDSVYLLSVTDTDNKQWPKVKGVFPDIGSIFKALERSMQQHRQDCFSISLAQDSNESLDQLNPSFMYTQILKEILLSIDFEHKHTLDFITYYREQSDGNSVELKNVDHLGRKYPEHTPIWWYTRNQFLYSTLNRALRTMEVNVIIKMGFFIRDLHEHIVALHSKQYVGRNQFSSFTVYRGQGLSQMDIDQLQKTKGGLISFNCFLSTSTNRTVSLAFAESNQNNADLFGVLFEITINPLTSSTSFASIRNVSYYQAEDEILFSMHSVFRIGEIQQRDENNHLWRISLTLTNDNDPQLSLLTKQIREETKGTTGWLRLGKLMVKLAQFNEAEDLYKILLDQSTNQRERETIFYQLGCIKCYQKKYAQAAVFYENSLKLRRKSLSTHHSDLAKCYNDIALMYRKVGTYSKAFSYNQKALKIKQRNLPPNHLSLAISYNNIGAVCYKTNERSKALFYYKKAHHIYLKTLPVNHPDMAICNNNIGLIYVQMGDYSKALSYYEKALHIRQKSLPPSHPTLAISYKNIGMVYDQKGEHFKARTYYEKAHRVQ